MVLKLQDSDSIYHGIFISQWHFMSYSIEFPPLVLHWCFKCFYLHPMLSYEPPHIGHIYPRPYLVQTWICISQWYFMSKQIAFPIDGSWEDLHNFLLLGYLLALSNKGSTSLVVSLTLLMPRCTRYNTICDKNGQWLATGRLFSPRHNWNIVESGVKNHQANKSNKLKFKLLLKISAAKFYWKK